MNEDEHYGPLMSVLTEKQRAFIIAMLTRPHDSAAKWAIAAGYSDAADGAKVRAHQLRNDPRILAAAREHAGQFLDSRGVTMAVGVLIHELTSPDAKIRMAAANSILDRGGITAKTEHTVRVEHNVEQMEAIAQRLAVELGIEPMKLIGGNTVQPEMEVGHSPATPASDARGTRRSEDDDLTF